MKKYLVIALLAVGCASSASPPVATTPTPAPTVAPASKYAEVTTFLRGLTTINTLEFQRLCLDVRGTVTKGDGFFVCSKSDAAFAIAVPSSGPINSSSLLVPYSEGKPIAQALQAQLGPPEFDGNTAYWDRPTEVFAFLPFEGSFLLIYEKKGISI